MPDNYYTIHRETRDSDDGTVGYLRLHGSLDIGSREELTEAIVAAVDQGAAEVVIDLDDVNFLDSEALAGLIEGYHAARDSGRRFRAVNANGIVRRVLTVTGTLELFVPARTHRT